MVFFLFFGILEYDPLYPLYPLRISLFLILGIYSTNSPDDHEYTGGGVGGCPLLSAIHVVVVPLSTIQIYQYACTFIYRFILSVDNPMLARVKAYRPIAYNQATLLHR